MKFRTFHNRIERNEFIFDRKDMLRLLTAEAKRLLASAPNGCASVSWDLDGDLEDGLTLTQSFEYLSPAVEQPASTNAVDPVTEIVTG